MRAANRLSLTSLALGLIASACAENSDPGGSVPFNSGNDPSTAGMTDAGAADGGNSPGQTDGGNTQPPTPMDAGSPPDAVQQCNVPQDAARGYRCTYINRIASGLLAPPDPSAAEFWNPEERSKSRQPQAP